MKKQQVISILFLIAVLTFSPIGNTILAGEEVQLQKVDAQVSELDNNSSLKADFKRKSPLGALSLSFAPFAVGAGLTAIGMLEGYPAMYIIGSTTLLLGPYAGHLYAKAPIRGAIYTGARLAGAGMVMGGFLLGEGDNAFAPLIFTGVAITAIAGIVGPIDAAFSAKRYNKKQKKFSLAPVVMPGAASSPAFGAQVNVRF